jgi:hypothetical protein
MILESWWKKIMIAVALLMVVAVGSVSAQEEQSIKKSYNLFNPTPEGNLRELNTDRPDKTDSPVTVDAGHIQVEMDIANYTFDGANAARGSTTSKAYQLVPVNLRVGVLEDCDLQLLLSPWQWDRSENAGGTVEHRTGFGDIVLRSKVNLAGNDGGFFALAIVPFVKLPTAQGQLGNGKVEFGLGIPYAFDVPAWDVGLEIALSRNGDNVGRGYYAEFTNSISIGHSIGSIVSCHMEFFNCLSTARDLGPVNTIDAWLVCKVDKNLSLDSGVYIGLSDFADDWHPWIGIAWRY